MPRFEFISGVQQLHAAQGGCVATIGSFDGVHLGHRALLARLIARARQAQLPATVILFEPQPMEFFRPAQAAPRILTLREKLRVLRGLGVDRVVCLRFNAALRAMPAEAFVTDILLRQLGVTHLDVGDDFRFGRNRQGDFALLEQMAQQWGFGLENSRTLCVAGERVSSTRIRQLLAEGDLAQANQLLGEPLTWLGRVIPGRQLARTLGAPTANLNLCKKPRPLAGVFAVQVQGAFGRLPGVANLGVKPSVTDEARTQLEVHLLSGQHDLYGQCLEVTFLHRLRAEQKFASLDLLKAQIQQDIHQARAFFTAQGYPLTA